VKHWIYPLPLSNCPFILFILQQICDQLTTTTWEQYESWKGNGAKRHTGDHPPALFVILKLRTLVHQARIWTNPHWWLVVHHASWPMTSQNGAALMVLVQIGKLQGLGVSNMCHHRLLRDNRMFWHWWIGNASSMWYLTSMRITNYNLKYTGTICDFKSSITGVNLALPSNITKQQIWYRFVYSQGCIQRLIIGLTQDST